jgi:hypothetical protein
MYDPNTYDPVAAYAEAMDRGDYTLALAIQQAANQNVIQAAAEQAFAEGVAAGQQQPQAAQSPEDEEKKQVAYRNFLEAHEPEPPKSEAQKIVDAHHESSYEAKVNKGLFKGIVPDRP